jgi:hypothetical protein
MAILMLRRTLCLGLIPLYVDPAIAFAPLDEATERDAFFDPFWRAA